MKLEWSSGLTSDDSRSPDGLHITQYNDCMVNILRELREEAGLSQAELADRSGAAQPNIAAYESGSRKASAAMMERLRRSASAAS